MPSHAQSSSKPFMPPTQPFLQAPGAEQSRQLAQRVLTEFWSTGGPRRLTALAAEQRRKLESYV